MLSIELQILIACIKIVLLNTPKTELLDLLEKSSIDWKKLNKMTVYHRIRPVVYEAFRQVNFNNDFTENLGLFAKRQSIKNLIDRQETAYILDFFKQQNIQALPYKGQLFLECLYQNKPLRESCDIDIIVQPENAHKALKLLVAEGYQLSVEGEPTDDLLEKICRFYGREVGLDKKTKVGKNVHIDFHWGINESFHEYPIGVNDFFEEAQLSDFYKMQVLMPSVNSIFKMLINHHGGRGCWLRLKDVCDFIAFQKAYPQLDTSKMFEIAEKMQMLNILKQGFHLSDTLFLDSTERTIIASQKITNEILVFWDRAKHYDFDNPIARFSYEKIYRSLQDKRWSWAKLALLNINYMSSPNLMENKRLMILPDRYIYLNFFIKLMSGIWRRAKNF
jgi:Uncharacterised nucleotidyltransferase